MARVYASVNATLGKGWYDYDNSTIEWSPPDRYEIVRRMGGGKYSEVHLCALLAVPQPQRFSQVFEGIDTANNDVCVIKVLKPVAKTKVKREIKVLRNLSGGPNVVGLIDVVRDPSGKYHSLIMEYVENVDWKVLIGRLVEADIKLYMFQMLKALDFVHSHGIMHRDVKPGNVMIDHLNRKLRLIDWGLAEFYHPGTDYHIRVGSRYYKSPELLVGYRKYDYSLDLWSLGCMFASMTFRREHFWRGSDNSDQLLRILKTLGTDKFDLYLQKYDINFETENDALLASYTKRGWTEYVTSETQHLASVEALDLLDKLLRYDHAERLTAHEAQAHVYFNSVRLEALSTKGEHVSDSGFCST
ncbi:kinase-like domain-containing protein [Desarmillaria tabescens]|uniref:Casein kinase II subunit alpha n=1 Tax=Armillaria tabescens TaxID=1929756 RepID=A0AA39N8U6_ARMTA|nr:kinase-like domain-containing protein [Desarmillaria tabescens]KAK0461165.1 kinase-like domain-containing protein [Desarmillaria tabescens]